MAPTPAPFCPQCGAPLQGSQRFCTNCGMTIETHASSPTLAASQAPFTPPAGGAQPGQPGAPGPLNPNAEVAPTMPSPTSLPGGSMYTNNNPSFVPPPPPPPLYNPYTNSMPVGPQSHAQTTVPDSYTPPPLVTPPPQAGVYQVPAYAQKQKTNHGCRNTSIVLLLVLALGIGGYFLFHSLTNKNSTGNTTGAQNTPAGSTQGNTGNKGNTPTTSANSITTQQLNLQITYSSVNITIISTQLAQSFADDSSTSAGSAGVVRINLRENNSTAHNSDYVESEVMLLLFPGGTTAQPNNEKESVSPDAGVNHQNWIDFQLNSPVTLNQLTLRLGTQTQNQMDIPLQPGADLSKYQDKTINPNTQFKYGSLNMTLKTAILSYSYNDVQATTGNRYLIITLAAVNNSTNSVELYPPAHMRMQAGGNSIQADNAYTLPITIDANTSGSGLVAFLVPQDATSFTLVLLAQTNPVIAQVTQTFQIQ